MRDNIFTYDAEILSSAFNQKFYTEIKKLEPFGTGNPSPTFLFKDLKVFKSTILDNKHVSLILKSRTGFSIKSICFHNSTFVQSQVILDRIKAVQTWLHTCMHEVQ